MPALPPYLIEPIFEQFSALLPEREVDHPLGFHRPRIPDRVVFEKLVRVLVFGCAYHRIADATPGRLSSHEKASSSIVYPRDPENSMSSSTMVRFRSVSSLSPLPESRRLPSGGS